MKFNNELNEQSQGNGPPKDAFAKNKLFEDRSSENDVLTLPTDLNGTDAAEIL